MAQKLGTQTILMENSPRILSYASVVSKKEGEGPLRDYFDIVNEDMLFSQKSWEKAESMIQETAVKKALEKARLKNSDIDFIFAGDLLNQCIGSSFGIREMNIPFIGLYGACSTMAESMALASVFIDSGSGNRVAAATSSHFCSSERQFRFPLEYGGQRPPTSQWTVTGAGAVILEKHSKELIRNPSVKAVCFGKIVDLGINDANNMGAAMAPAAWDTIKTFLEDTNTKSTDYDLILTGDLGHIGSNLLKELALEDGVDLRNHSDCGKLIFDREAQDVHSGGSGCGCAASVLCSYVFKKMEDNIFRNVLFCATGALMSPTACQQGESIPGIAHLLHIEA